MSNHQKRLSVPKSWPVERKTSTFTVAAGAGPHGKDGVPLLILLRDVLGYVDSRKEARYALNEGGILVNGEPISDESRPIGMFDIVAFPAREEYYRVFPDEGGRLSLTPIDPDAAESRLGKVVGKQQVDGGDTQLTLHDGTNLITEDDGINTTDSIVVDNDDKSIVAHFPFETGALVTAVRGNHGGKIGDLESITVTPGSGPNTVAVTTADGSFETIQEYLVVIDENFTDDDEADADDGDTDADDAADADVDDSEPDADDAADADVDDSDATDEDDDASGGDDE